MLQRHGAKSSGVRYVRPTRDYEQPSTDLDALIRETGRQVLAELFERPELEGGERYLSGEEWSAQSEGRFRRDLTTRFQGTPRQQVVISTHAREVSRALGHSDDDVWLSVALRQLMLLDRDTAERLAGTACLTKGLGRRAIETPRARRVLRSYLQPWMSAERSSATELTTRAISRRAMCKLLAVEYIDGKGVAQQRTPSVGAVYGPRGSNADLRRAGLLRRSQLISRDAAPGERGHPRFSARDGKVVCWATGQTHLYAPCIPDEPVMTLGHELQLGAAASFELRAEQEAENLDALKRVRARAERARATLDAAADDPRLFEPPLEPEPEPEPEPELDWRAGESRYVEPDLAWEAIKCAPEPEVLCSSPILVVGYTDPLEGDAPDDPCERPRARVARERGRLFAVRRVIVDRLEPAPLERLRRRERRLLGRAMRRCTRPYQTPADSVCVVEDPEAALTPELLSTLEALASDSITLEPEQRLEPVALLPEPRVLERMRPTRVQRAVTQARAALTIARARGRDPP